MTSPNPFHDPDEWYQKNAPNLSPEKRKTLDERRDIYDCLAYVQLLGVEKTWLKDWADKVASMDGSTADLVRRAIPWIVEMFQLHLKDVTTRKSYIGGVTHALESGDLDRFQAYLRGQGVKGNFPDAFSLAALYEVRDLRDTYAAKILGDYTALQTMWNQHGEQIRRNWRVMPEDRRVRLLGSWSKINDNHRMDFASLVQNGLPERGSLGEIDEKQLGEGAWKWPTISIEDLRKGDLLLTCLESRATASPGLFCWEEVIFGQLRVLARVIKATPLYSHYCFFPLQTSVDTYGEVISAHEVSQACLNHQSGGGERQDDGSIDWVAYHRGLPTRNAIPIMQRQTEIYEFLKTVCELVRDENPISPASTGQHNGQSQTSEEPEVDPIIKLLTEHWYRKPGEADTKSLLEILEARKSRIRNDIISMRKDPLFFADLLRQYRDHDPEVISVEKGRKNLKTNNKALRSKQFNGKIMLRMIKGMLIQFFIARDLVKSFKILQKIAEESKPKLQNPTGMPGEKLPKDFVIRCIKVIGKLHNLINRQIKSVSQGFAASPNFRERFLRSEDRDETDSYKIRLDTHKLETLREYGTFTTIMGRLVADDKIGKIMMKDAPLIIAELQRLFQLDGITKDKLSPFMANELTDLTVFRACWAQIWQYQPCGMIFDDACRIETKHIDNAVLELLGLPTYIGGYLDEGPWDKLVEPFLKDFDALYNCPQTRENTSERRKAEAYLKKVWDRVASQLSKDNIHPSLKDILNQEIIVTPKWDARKKSEEPSITASPPTAPGKGTSPKSASSADSLKRVRDEAGPEEEEVIAPPKKKVKNRGVADVSKAQRPIREGTLAEADIAPEKLIPDHIEVHRRHLPTLQYLFFQEGQTDHSGDIPWISFCQAMADIGFGITSLGGSEVRFTPPAAWRTRSVIIHSPHPERNMRYRKARDAGTRLSNHYDFNSHTFVLRED